MRRVVQKEGEEQKALGKRKKDKPKGKTVVKQVKNKERVDSDVKIDDVGQSLGGITVKPIDAAEMLKQDMKMVKRLTPMILHKPKHNRNNINEPQVQGQGKEEDRSSSYGGWNEWNFWKLPTNESLDDV